MTYGRFLDDLRKLWKVIAKTVEHPLSGFVSVIVLLGWFVLSRVSGIDKDLTFLGAASNSLQTFLLFAIAAAQAANAVSSIAVAKAAHQRAEGAEHLARSAHAHAQAAHARLDIKNDLFLRKRSDV